MTKQDRVLQALKACDKETLGELLHHAGPELVNYCIEKGCDGERAVELVLHLFIRWIMDGFATATWPLAEWMASEIDAECERVRVALN